MRLCTDEDTGTLAFQADYAHCPLVMCADHARIGQIANTYHAHDPRAWLKGLRHDSDAVSVAFQKREGDIAESSCACEAFTREFVQHLGLALDNTRKTREHLDYASDEHVVVAAR